MLAYPHLIGDRCHPIEMLIQRIRYCLQIESIRRRFDFFCIAPSESEALQKLANWMDQNPGQYRSICGGFSLSSEELPKGVALAGLGVGAVVEAGC
jgi:hypothetical protein